MSNQKQERKKKYNLIKQIIIFVMLILVVLVGVILSEVGIHRSSGDKVTKANNIITKFIETGNGTAYSDSFTTMIENATGNEKSGTYSGNAVFYIECRLK